MLKGSIVALITPFTDNNEVNYKKLSDLIEMHVFAETDGLVLLGTTGESASLTDKEKDEIVKYAIKQVNKRMKIVVGVITNNTFDGIIKAKKYASYGADYLLVTPPYYNKTNKSGLFKHFKLISESVNIPIIIYNIPSRIGLNIEPHELLELKTIKNIYGVKESNKNINHIIEVANICDENFNLYCGNDDLIYIFLSLGASGLINVYGNLNPIVIKNMIYIFENNLLLARRYFLQHYDLFKELSIEVNPIPIKTLMNYIGFNVGDVRLPLDEMNSVNKEILIKSYIKVLTCNVI